MISFAALRRASLHRLANIPGLAAPNSKPYAKLWGNSLIESQPVCHPPKMSHKTAHFFSSSTHKGNYSNSPIDKTIDANVSWQESTRLEWETRNTVNLTNTTNTASTENKANTANTENREEKLKEQLKKELTQYLDHKFEQQRKSDKQQLKQLFASRILPELKALNSQSTQKSTQIFKISQKQNKKIQQKIAKFNQNHASSTHQFKPIFLIFGTLFLILLVTIQKQIDKLRQQCVYDPIKKSFDAKINREKISSKQEQKCKK